MTGFTVVFAVMALVELIWLVEELRIRKQYEEVVIKFMRALKKRKSVKSEEDQELFKVFYDAVGLCKVLGLDWTEE